MHTPCKPHNRIFANVVNESSDGSACRIKVPEIKKSKFNGRLEAGDKAIVGALTDNFKANIACLEMQTHTRVASGAAMYQAALNGKKLDNCVGLLEQLNNHMAKLVQLQEQGTRLAASSSIQVFNAGSPTPRKRRRGEQERALLRDIGMNAVSQRDACECAVVSLLVLHRAVLFMLLTLLLLCVSMMTNTMLTKMNNTPFIHLNAGVPRMHGRGHSTPQSDWQPSHALGRLSEGIVPAVLY